MFEAFFNVVLHFPRQHNPPHSPSTPADIAATLRCRPSHSLRASAVLLLPLLSRHLSAPPSAPVHPWALPPQCPTDASPWARCPHCRSAPRSRCPRENPAPPPPACYACQTGLGSHDCPDSARSLNVRSPASPARRWCSSPPSIAWKSECPAPLPSPNAPG